MIVKILMVCLGNICRSPLAEGILAAKLPQNSFVVDSAGTGDWHVGSPPDERSIRTAQKHGIDISAQRAQQFHPSFFQEYDYIYVMDSRNYKNVMKMAVHAGDQTKIHLILDELYPNKKRDVPDPYYGDLSNFDEVYELLDTVCEQIAQKHIAKYPSK